MFRLKAEKECKLLEDFYEKYMKSDLPYKIDANLQENLEAEQDKIYTKICKKEKTQKKIKIDTKDEVTRFETKKETIEVQINDIEERIHKEAVSIYFICDRPVGRAVTRLSLERQVCGSNLEPIKSDKVLPKAHHR